MSLYEVLKASKTNRFPDYWTLLWGRKLSASMIKTLTGTLPLTFTAKAGNAVDWVIYGNDENGTENLCELTIANCGIDGNGTLAISTAWQMICAPIVSGEEYTIVSDNIVYGFYTSKPEVSSTAYNSTRYAPGGTTRTFTADINGWVAIRLESGRSDVTMLVKGSTAPDHYIPYQKGVGERTENLWDLTIEQGSFDPTTGATAAGSRRVRTAESILLSANSWTVALIGADRCGVYVYDTNGNYIASESEYYWQALPYTFMLSGERKVKFVFSTNDDAQITLSMVSQPMLTEGSTPPSEYIPYGYQIPISVTNGTETKTTDVYIGDSPLTEGETVSKTSTGVDIELFEGENTVSTTLYNKPDMEIKYK